MTTPSKVVATRVPQADADALTAAAKARGLTPSAWLRRMIEAQNTVDRASGRLSA